MTALVKLPSRHGSAPIRLTPVLLGALLGLLVPAALSASGPDPAAAGNGGVRPGGVPAQKAWGDSAEGRPIVVRRYGDPASPFKVLVVGSIHGDEPQGMRVVERINSGREGMPGRIDLWTIRTVNPDGTRAGTRKNARGVDLNRNFGFRFDPSLTGGYESGPFPFSEPESRTVARISRRARFDLAVWYHQPWNETLVPATTPAGSRGATRSCPASSRRDSAATPMCPEVRSGGCIGAWTPTLSWSSWVPERSVAAR